MNALRALSIVALAALLPTPAAAGRRAESFPLEESRRLEHRFAGARALAIDNWRGPITVTAGDRPDVAMTIVETFAARTPEGLARARREVTLALTTEAGEARARVEGPFRCGRDHGCCCGRDLPYRVTYAFAVEVPLAIDLELCTVDGGDVRVAGTRGAFAIKNVNGGVELEGVDGAGSAATVNGPVRVRFASNPAAGCRFTTVNGDVDVAFRRGLAADFFFATMNGEAWSDFPFVLQPLPARHQQRREDGMRVYRSDRVYAVRVAGGGPQIELETLNGDILIREQKSQ